MEKELKAFNDLSAKLLKEFSMDKDNLVISPFSIMILLCMAADACKGKTRKEIIEALGKDLCFEDLKKMIFELNRRFDDGKLKTANALGVDHAFEKYIRDEFRKMLLDDYDGEVFASEDLINDINSWVNDKTRGMIDKLLDDSFKNLAACLMNAICFESNWQKEYADKDIRQLDFNSVDGSKTKTDFLCSVENVYLNTEDLAGFIKPYEGNDYYFMALLPKEKTYEKLCDTLEDLDLKKLLSSRTLTKVKVMLPEFRYDFTKSLNQCLNKFGISTLFSTDADLSRLSSKQLYVSSILHKAHIEVDRQGTRAAAATGMVMFKSAMPGMHKIPLIRFDRPFIYAIMHAETSVPVFAGICNRI